MTNYGMGIFAFSKGDKNHNDTLRKGLNMNEKSIDLGIICLQNLPSGPLYDQIYQPWEEMRAYTERRLTAYDAIGYGGCPEFYSFAHLSRWIKTRRMARQIPTWPGTNSPFDQRDLRIVEALADRFYEGKPNPFR